jgi:TonB family protein
MGRGSLVRVFRAFDKGNGRLVTLKIGTERADKDFAARFLSEAAAVSKLRDSGIAAVYDFGEEEGLPFAAMQYPDGERLDRAISERREFTLLSKTAIMWHVARGIDALHSTGIVAEIRPDGVVLGTSGSAIILDFGMLRLLPADDQKATAYRSPEEIAGTAPDFLSDIFSFGAIYYELLTGSSLGESAGAISDRLPGCTDALETLVRQAVEKRRELRYQSFAELQCDAAATISELRRAHIAGALPEIRTMMDSGHFNRAQEALADLLQVDSGNRAANRLLVELRARLHRQTLTSRIASLCHESDMAKANGDLEGAIELLRSALRVDPENVELRTRLSSLAAEVDRVRRYADTVQEAHRLFDSKRLTDAREKLLEAIEIDPTGKGAQDLLATVVAAILRAEADSKIERAAQKARELADAHDFDQALTLLERVRCEFPACSSIEEQIETIHILSNEANAALTQAIEEADLLVGNGRPDLALELLRERPGKLPHRPEIRRRISELEVCLPAWKTHRAVQDALARANALERLNEGTAALTVLEETLTAYPDLAELRDAVHALRTRSVEQERRRKLERRMQAIRQSVSVQDWPQALALLEAATAEFPAETELSSQLAEVREAIRTSERKRVCAETRRLLAEGEIEEADRILQNALETLGEAPDIAALCEELASRRTDEEDWRSAKALFGRRHFDEAERILERLAEHNRAEAAALLELIRKERAISVEEQFYEDGRNRAVKLVERGEYEQAADLLRNLLALFPGDPILVRRLAAAEVGIGHKGATSGAGEGPVAKPQLGEPESQSIPPLGVIERTGSAQPTGTRARAIALMALAAVAIGAVVIGRSQQSAPKLATRLRNPSTPASSRPIPVEAKNAAEQTPPVSPAQAGAAPAPAGAAPAPAGVAPAQAGAAPAQAGAAPAQAGTAPAPAIHLPTAHQVNNEVRLKVAQRSFVPPPASSAAAAPVLASELPPADRVAVPPIAVQGMPAHLPTATAPPPPLPAPKTVEAVAKPAPVGGKVELAKLLQSPPPRLPELARQLGISGEVKLEITISMDGSVKSVRAISGHAVLVQAAKQAVGKWRYQPAKLDGMPIESQSVASFRFEARP